MVEIPGQRWSNAPVKKKGKRDAAERSSQQRTENSAPTSAAPICPKLSLSKLTLSVTLPDSLAEVVKNRHGQVAGQQRTLGSYVQLLSEGFAHFVQDCVRRGVFRQTDQPRAGAVEIHGQVLQLPFSCSSAVAKSIRSHTNLYRCLPLYHFALGPSRTFPAMLSAANPSEVLVQIQGLPYGMSDSDLQATMLDAKLPVIGDVVRPPTIFGKQHHPAWFACATIGHANTAYVSVRTATRRLARQELVLRTPHGPHTIRLSVVDRPQQPVILDEHSVRRMREGLNAQEQLQYRYVPQHAYATSVPAAGRPVSMTPPQPTHAATESPETGVQPAAQAAAAQTGPPQHTSARMQPAQTTTHAPAAARAQVSIAAAMPNAKAATPAPQSAPAPAAGDSAHSAAVPQDAAMKNGEQARASKRDASEATAAACDGASAPRRLRRALSGSDKMDTALHADDCPVVPQHQSLGGSTEAMAEADCRFETVVGCMDAKAQSVVNPQVRAVIAARPAQYVQMAYLLLEVAKLAGATDPQQHSHALRPRFDAFMLAHLSEPAACLADLMERMKHGLSSLHETARDLAADPTVLLSQSPTPGNPPASPLAVEHNPAVQHTAASDPQDAPADGMQGARTLFESVGNDDYTDGVIDDETSSTSSDPESITPTTTAAVAPAAPHPSEGGGASTPHAEGA